MRRCKSCDSSVVLSEEDIYEITKKTKELSSDKVVDKDSYRKRINICKACSALLYETTCSYSGYIIFVKARELSASCAKPGSKLW